MMFRCCRDRRLTVLWMLFVIYGKYTEGQHVYKAPPKEVSLQVGNDLVLSWCVSASQLVSSQPLKPLVVFFLQGGCDISSKRCRLAQRQFGEATILPDLTNNIYKTMFSQNQLDVLESNCSSDGTAKTNFTLVVRNITSTQASTYKLVADYGVKEIGVEHYSKVQVLVPPSVSVNSTTTAYIGDKVKLTCHVSGVPLPTVNWTKGNNVLSSNLTLTVSDVVKEHAGVYRCTASNGVGSDATADINLLVYYMDVRCSVLFDNSSFAPQLIIEVPGNTPTVTCTGFQNCNGVNELRNINYNQYSRNVSVVGGNGKIVIYCHLKATSVEEHCKKGSSFTVKTLSVQRGAEKSEANLASDGKKNLVQNNGPADIIGFRTTFCSAAIKGATPCSSLAAIFVAWAVLSVLGILT